MNSRQLTLAGAINMFLAVSAGAFGAHALKAMLSPELLAVWQTGVTYQMAHALGLLALGALLPQFPSQLLPRAGNVMLAGIVIFSGSLYALALSGIKLLGAITPFGGIAFLVAWAMIAWAVYRKG